MHLDRHTLLRRVILAMGVLLIADAVASAFIELFFPTGYFSGKSIPRIVSDLAFVEGAAIFFVGGLLAFFHSNLSPRAITLLIVGASMVGLSVLFGVLS